MKTLHIIDKTGDTQFDLETEFDLATQFFQQKLAEGHMAYEVDPLTKNKTHIFELSPQMEQVVVHGPHAGG